jgi:hypothetical protein
LKDIPRGGGGGRRRSRRRRRRRRRRRTLRDGSFKKYVKLSALRGSLRCQHLHHIT